MARAGTTPKSITETEHDQLVDLYDSDLRYTSRHLGRLFNHLKDLEIWDETAIVLTADHGEEFCEHGHYFHRNRPYDELIRVPLVLKTPNYSIDPDGSRELLDVAPTICELHTLSSPDAFQGTALSKDRSGPLISRGSIIDGTPAVTVRYNDWKCIFGDDGPELYDVNANKEQQDVSAHHPDVIQKCREVLPDGIQSTDAPQNLTATDTVEDRLADLGYLDS